MGVLPSWLPWVKLQAARYSWQRDSLPQGQIDMGNGRVLGAEDVLEGHYRRLTTNRQHAADQLAADPRVSQHTSPRAAHQVAVQVGDNLTVAITVFAPALAPLTEVAEQVSGAVPLVEPERHFRENLHQALERTHRQHAAQRVLGTRPAPRPKPSKPLGWWVALAGAVAMVALLWGWRWRQGTAPAA
jgi:hypothetical protein